MHYREEFADMMSQQGILSPQARHLKWVLSRTRKSEGPPIPKNEEADKAYTAAERAYVASCIFTELGYDTLIRTSYEDLAKNFTPCEDKTGQCSLDCYGKRMCEHEQRTKK